MQWTFHIQQSRGRGRFRLSINSALVIASQCGLASRNISDLPPCTLLCVATTELLCRRETTMTPLRKLPADVLCSNHISVTRFPWQNPSVHWYWLTLLQLTAGSNKKKKGRKADITLLSGSCMKHAQESYIAGMQGRQDEAGLSLGFMHFLDREAQQRK